MKTLVLGIGNPILQDDSVGLHVARELQRQITDPDVVVDMAYTGGFNLVDQMVGYEKAILIDAIHEKNASTGEVKRFTLSELPAGHTANPHDVSLPEAFRLAKILGETRLPNEVVVFGIVSPTAPATFGEHVSRTLAPAIPKTVQMVLDELHSKSGMHKSFSKVKP